MRGKLVIDYTQGLAQVFITPKGKGHNFKSYCDKKGCKEFEDFETLETAYDHAMDHHNKYHRL